MSGVTGLSTSDGKSRILGDRISGVPGRGEPEYPDTKPCLMLTIPGPSGLILKFLRLFLRSYSLDPDLSFRGPVLIGGIAWRVGSGRPAWRAVSVDPVSIWTTCLKELVSACTNVVGYGLFGSDLVMGTALGVVGGGWWWTPLVVVLLVELVELRLLGDGTKDGLCNPDGCSIDRSSFFLYFAV